MPNRHTRYIQDKNQSAAILSLPQAGIDYNATNLEDFLEQAFFNPTYTSAIGLPIGTTAQAPAAINGYLRYDSDLAKLRGVEGGVWKDIITGGIGGSIGENEIAFGNSTGDIISDSDLIFNPSTSLLTLNGELTATGTNIRLEGTGSLLLPLGTTAQRPTATNGLIRYNSTNSKFEAYEAGAWKNVITTATGITIGENEIAFGDSLGNILSSNQFTMNPGLSGSGPTIQIRSFGGTTSSILQSDFSADHTYRSTSSAGRFFLRSNGDNDTGSNPLIYIQSSISGANILIRPTIAGYNNATKQWQFAASGQYQLSLYGAGTFTGTATRYLAVDSSGNVIEQTIPSSFSVTNELDNRIITSTGSGTGNAEANLTFDGTTLLLTGTETITGQLNVDNLRLDGNSLITTNTDGDFTVDPNGNGNILLTLSGTGYARIGESTPSSPRILTVGGQSGFNAIALYRLTSVIGNSVGGIDFIGRNVSSADVSYGLISTEIVDNTAGSHDGKILIRPTLAGTNTTIAEFNPLGDITLTPNSSNHVNINAGGLEIGGTQVISSARACSFISGSLTNTTNQLVLGTTNITTINSVAPAASRIYTIPDFGSNDTFVGLAATQTLTNKTLTSPTIGGTPSASGATWSNLGTVTTVDVNGGTIDGTTIGGTTPAAGSFTMGNFGSQVTLYTSTNGYVGSESGTFRTRIEFNDSENAVKFQRSSNSGSSYANTLTIDNSSAVSTNGGSLSAGATDVSSLAIGGFGALRVAQVTLTPSQIANLHTTPITIVTAPGAGNWIAVQRVQITKDYNSVAYNSVNLIISANDGFANYDYVNDSAVLPGVSDRKNSVSIDTVDPGDDIDDVQVIVRTSGSAGASGNSNVRVKIWYTIEAIT